VPVVKVLPLTDVGVMAPRVSEIAGVVVAVATVPDTPFAVLTDTDVTVPEPPPPPPPAESGPNMTVFGATIWARAATQTARSANRRFMA
jgi:hypothetical protein